MGYCHFEDLNLKETTSVDTVEMITYTHLNDILIILQNSPTLSISDFNTICPIV